MNHQSDEQLTPAPDGRPAAAQPAWRTDFPIDTPQDHYVARPARLVRCGHWASLGRPAAPAVAARASGDCGRLGLCDRRGGAHRMKQPFSSEQRTTIIYAILCLILFTTVLQLWLLSATMN